MPEAAQGRGSRAGWPLSEHTGARRGRGVHEMSMGARQARQGGRIRVPAILQTSQAAHEGEINTSGQSRR